LLGLVVYNGYVNIFLDETGQLSKNINGNYFLIGSFTTGDPGHLYTEIVTQLIRSYLPIKDLDFRVFCDQRNLKGLTKEDFKSIITANIVSQLTLKTIIQIERMDSTTNANIQIADWICGALGRYHNKGKMGKEFFGVLKNNLLGEGIELFRDYWSKNQKTQFED